MTYVYFSWAAVELMDLPTGKTTLCLPVVTDQSIIPAVYPSLAVSANAGSWRFVCVHFVTDASRIASRDCQPVCYFHSSS